MSRLSKERMEKALKQLEVISADDYAKVKNVASIVKPLRSVLHKTPDDYGMTGWQDIYFPSDDGLGSYACYRAAPPQPLGLSSRTGPPALL
jgi:hypothetical protein